MKIVNCKLKIVKQGFTLIELMVVIGIVVLLTVGSIVGISASRDRRQVKTTAEKLKSFLMEARSMAMNTADTDTNTNIFVQYDAGNNKLKIMKDSAEAQSLTLPTGVTLGSFNNIAYSASSSTRGKITAPSPNAAGNITFNVVGIDSKMITVNITTGLVTIN